MLEIAQISDKSENEWEGYAKSKPQVHFYYDYRWRKVLGESFGHPSFYLAALEGKNIVGFFPLVFIKNRVIGSSLISVPFFNYGGILADNEETELFLLNKAVDILKDKRGAYLEIRSYKKLNLPLVTREHKVTMWLELSGDIVSQWQSLSAKLRNLIRKSEKSKLEVKTGKAELLDKFYQVFCRNMRDLGTPVLGMSFFGNILKYFSEEATIFIVEFKNKPIAAAFTLCHADTLEIPWASSVKVFNKFCPNEFMYWEALKYAISKGIKKFDFGRCTKDSGTYNFKKQWNPQVVQLYWQYWAKQASFLPTDKPQESKFAPLIAMWKRLPLFVTNRIGPVIAKDMPVF